MRHLPRGHQRALVSAPFCLVWSVSAAVLATEADSPLAKEIRQAQDWAKSAFAKPTARTETASTSKSVSSLEVDDGGNGRERDQCTWADASVTLDDGTIQFLDEIPLDSGRRTQQTAAPFSFTYGGVSSEELLPAWEYSFVEEPVKNGSRRTISYKCPKTGMRLECLVTTYSDAAGVDWVVYLTNEATEDTPLIDRLLPLHATLLETRPDEQVTLRSSKGDDFSPSSFMPHDEPIALNQIRQFRANGGRSSDGEGGGAFPFFNVLGANGGWILAVGWSGQWSAELLRRNPHITIDNCASGGRRIDIEINTLSYPLWRSDFNDIGEGLKGPQYWPQMAMTDQNMFLGLALYIPFQAGPLWDMQPYSFRSAMTSSVVLYERILHEEFPDELAKQGIAELKELRPLFLGDVYPLTKRSTSQAVWHAYQLARADLGQGCALFFRRPDCPKPTCQVQLHNIDLEAFYMVSQTGETYTKGKPKKMKGRDLARLPVQMDTKPGSILLRYRKVGP
jgi:hypothetical protein